MNSSDNRRLPPLDLYPVKHSKLRVCASYLREERNRKALRNCRLIMLEHILPTTENFIYLLADAGAQIHSILAKPFSIDRSVFRRLLERGFTVLEKPYEDLEDTDILDSLIVSAAQLSKEDGKNLVLIDVGGYFAKPLTRLSKSEYEPLAGVIEDTTYGHNRYLSTAKNISVPIISVARSNLKEIEAHFVGKDAVQALDFLMRSVGDSIAGRRAVVIGYGMIGKNVARYLQANDLGCRSMTLGIIETLRHL